MKLTIITQDAKREVDIQSSNSDISLFPLANVTGASTSRELSIPFSYGVVNPFELWSGSGFVRRVSLAITEPFPLGTELSVGTAANPGLLLSAEENAPAFVGEYTVSRWHLLQEPSTIQLGLSLPPGTDRGRGYLVLLL